MSHWAKLFADYLDHEEMRELREQLADLEHRQWAHWTRYMLDNLSPENIERWRRQIETRYSDLTEKEKASDREWADKALSLPRMMAILEKAEKWDRLIPYLTKGDEEEAIEDIMPHGWTKWGTAYKHYCYECSDKLWDPPCDVCETQPCTRGGCWANPPLHLFPYETYYAEAIPWTELWTIFEKWSYTMPLDSYFAEVSD